MNTFSPAYVSVVLLAAVNLAAHPADTNKDSRIDLNELTAYGQAYNNAAGWPEGPSPIDEAHYERAVFIWQAGERYRSVENMAGPFGWIPDPLAGPPYVALSSDRAEPFDEMTVHGFSAEGPLTARFRLDDIPGYFQTLVYDSGEELLVSVPLNPLTLTGEGTVYLELVNPDSGDVWRCPPLRLLPLPGSPGAGIQLVTSIGSSLEQASSLSGYNLDDYQDTTDLAMVPDSIRPLLFAKGILDHPENPYAFDKLVGNMSETELAIWDSIVAKLDLANRITSPVGSSAPSLAFQAFSLKAGAGVAPRAGCDGNEFRQINDVLTLSQLMIAQGKADDEISDKDSARDIADILMNMQGSYDLGKKVGEALEGIKSKAGGSGVLSAIGTTLMIAKFFDYFDAGTLPSVFLSLEKTIDGPDRGYFIEDDSADNCGEATLMLSATVRSRGYDHEEMLANVAPSSPLPGLPGWNTLFKWIYDRYPNLDLMDLEPRTWCNIPGLGNDEYTIITGDAYLKVTGYNDEKVGMDFIPLKAGPGLLTIEIRRDKFGGAGFNDTAEYETRPIEVEILSPKLTVSGNEESVTYQAQLSDAAQLGPDDLEWTVTSGQILGQTALGQGRYELTWKPTDKEDDYPVIITARSTTTACLRGKAGAPPRESSISVELDPWEILPVMACLQAGAQEIFFIDNGTGNPPEVTWEVVSGPGTIEADSGLFTAGAFGGNVTIQATRTDNMETQTQTFRVGCSLYGEIAFDPADAPSEPGTVKALTASLTLGFQALVTGDVFMTYETIEPPTGDGQHGYVSGTFQGAGRYLPNNVLELFALTDSTDAIRSYPNGEGGTYDVVASYFYQDITEDEGNIILPDGPDGDLMEIRLDAFGYARAGYVEGISNEIVSYFWTFSDGTSDVGPMVTKTFSRSRSDLVIELEVFDKLGNWARIKEKILIVQINGTYRFAYDPTHTETACIYWTWAGDPPDDLVDPDVNWITTRDPDECGSTVILTGGRAATISAESTQSGIDSDSLDQHYILSFLNF